MRKYEPEFCWTYSTRTELRLQVRTIPSIFIQQD